MRSDIVALERLARLEGVQSRYIDIHGKSVVVAPETLVAILESLDLHVRGPGDASKVLRERRAARANVATPPVIVVWDETPPRLWLRLRAATTELRFRLEREDGEVREWTATPTPFSERGRREERGLVASVTLPPLPYGYHRLDVEIEGRAYEILVLRAPTRSYRARDDRRWGVFAPLYALHSKSSPGIGSYSDLGRLAAMVHRRGGGFVATLPFYASFPGEVSPYSPMTRLFWSELFVDAGGIPPSRPSNPIDYVSRAREQERALRERWIRERGARDDELTRFAAREPQVEDFARFRARLDHSGASAGDAEPDAVRYHVFAQWLADSALLEPARKGAPLYLDLPLGVHRHGYDVASEPELFAEGVDVGAPPDGAFPGGQNWSFPPIRPDASRRQHHRHLRDVIAKAMRHASLLRVDHVMGVHRQFWIPSSDSAESGTYVRYPADELYAVLSLESHRARCEVVGEDLGLVPDVVRTQMRRHGLRGLYVSQLMGSDDIPEHAVASLNTHDTDTFAGSGGDAIALERELARLLASRAGLVSISLEDLWLEPDSQNVPGTTFPARTNWSRPLRYSIEEIDERYGPRLSGFTR